jgi:adenosylhomocysteinase
MKDGCIIANSGHFNVEINIPALVELSDKITRPRPYIEEYHFKDGRKIRLLAEGRLVNLAAAEGHPATVMDMSFANQALSAVHLWKQEKSLDNQVHPVPKVIDQEIAAMKLAAMGINIDTLTDEQQDYLSSWQQGT